MAVGKRKKRLSLPWWLDLMGKTNTLQQNGADGTRVRVLARRSFDSTTTDDSPVATDRLALLRPRPGQFDVSRPRISSPATSKFVSRRFGGFLY